MKKRRLRIDGIIILSLLCILFLELCLGCAKYIRFKQNERLNSTYTTLIRDGEVIEMTQKELKEYYEVIASESK